MSSRREKPPPISGTVGRGSNNLGRGGVNEREVMVGGWLADPEGDATPIQLVVFVAGAVAARTQTQGERPDVTREFSLYFGSEKNVAFQATFACRSGEQPVAVAVGS